MNQADENLQLALTSPIEGLPVSKLELSQRRTINEGRFQTN